MRIWLINIGEPVPIKGQQKDRLHRTGYFAHFLASHGHDVIWWASTFDHARKTHLFTKDTSVEINHHLTIKLIHAFGYSRNISLARIWDHFLLAKKFSIAALKEAKPDIILSSIPTIELSSAALDYALTHKVPMVVDARDMWPDIFIDSVGAFLKPAVKLCTVPIFRKTRRILSNATAIMGITDDYVQWGLNRGNRKKNNKYDKAFPLGYISQPPEKNSIIEAEKFWDNKGVSPEKYDFVVCCVTNITKWSDIITVINSVKRINNMKKKVLFVLCGSGDAFEYYKRITRDDPDILLPGWVNAAQIYVLMRRSVIGFDPLMERYDFLATINNKAIEYLSAGLPVISCPDYGVLSDLLRKHQCGMSYPTGDADYLVNLLVSLFDDREKLKIMSRKALQLYQDQFTAEKVYMDMMKHILMIAKEAKVGV